jgi:hypothetical protein
MELNTIESAVFTNTPDFKPQNQRDYLPFDKGIRNPLYNDLMSEAGEDIVRYLESFDLLQSRNFILLSSKRHYLYGPEELRLVKTVINLKPINQIEQINYTLRTMNRVLPMKGNFVGCFMDYKTVKKSMMQVNSSKIAYLLLMMHWIDSRFISQIPLINRVQYIMNPRKMKSLTSAETQRLLVNNGFSVKNITEINGLTYFISQKTKHAKSESIPFIKLIDIKSRSNII